MPSPNPPSRSPSTRDRRRARGVTLIELMIAVAVVAILAAIAFPSYQEQVRKSRRNAAQTVMLEVAQKQNQLYLDARRFSAAADAAALAAAPLRVAVPNNVSAFYTLSVTAANPADAAATFTVTAAPSGTQTSDSCGTLTVNQAGVKTPATGCW
jgi:type IV pilus assembly protein PilE